MTLPKLLIWTTTARGGFMTSRSRALQRAHGSNAHALCVFAVVVDAYVRKAAHAALHNLSKAFGPIIMQPVYS
jgi:hypothetical protein